jgi:hypothetical protein
MLSMHSAVLVLGAMVVLDIVGSVLGEMVAVEFI